MRKRLTDNLVQRNTSNSFNGTKQAFMHGIIANNMDHNTETECFLEGEIRAKLRVGRGRVVVNLFKL